MKFKLLTALVLFALVIGGAATTRAQFDLGNPDTLILMTSRPEAGANDSTFKVELWVYDDANVLTGISMGWNWDNPNLVLDSFVPSAKATAAFSTNVVGYEDGNIATSNANKRAQFVALWLLNGSFWHSNATRDLAGTWYFSLSNWTAGSSITVDTNIWSVGQDMTISDSVSGDSYIPVWFMGDAPIIVRDPSETGGTISPDIPKTYSLSQNYPNPFNPTTTIEFAMPVEGTYKLTVYNVIGQVVKEFNGQADAGIQTVTWDASDKASGIYFYRLNAGKFTETKKMMLVK